MGYRVQRWRGGAGRGLLFALGLAGGGLPEARAASEARAELIQPLAGRPILDLRVGASTGTGQHPQLCLEGYPLARLSVEMCGTGSGLLHRQAGPDFAHFRARYTLLEARGARSDGELVAGAGFAEVQRSADQPGFRFGPATEPEPVEAAGPELSLSARGRLWVQERAYVVADLNAGAAWIPAAPEVMGSAGPAVPFAQFTLGMGL